MTRPAPTPAAYRLLREPQAAAYCGVSPSKFREMVEAGTYPPGHLVDRCRVWDVRALDAAIDALLYGSPAAAKGAEEWA